MSEATPPKKSLRRRIMQVLAMVITIAFPFLVITLLPVGRVVAKLDQLLDRLGPLAIISFVVLYVLDALVLGPAWLFALVAGLAFGLGRGIAVVWIAAMLGAAAGFLIARYVARHRVEKLAKKNDKFGAVDRAIEKNGWKVVLLLRSSPLLPYTVSNYLYGLAAIRFVPYLIASGLGMIPMIAVYVSIGAAGREAALAAAGGGHHQSVVEWIVLGVGLLFTIAAALLIARAAKRELAAMRIERQGAPPLPT